MAVDTALVLGQLGNSASQALRAYRKFIEDGQGLGHEERYYRAVDQRFLGDEMFVQQVAQRAPQSELRPAKAKIRFERLLHAVAQIHACGVKDPTAAGRQRAWSKLRAQPAYLARDWCGMKAIEVARRLNRDPSMVSRLCAEYEAVRNPKSEEKIAEAVDK